MQWHIKTFYDMKFPTLHGPSLCDSSMYAIFTYYKELKWNTEFRLPNDENLYNLLLLIF